LAELENTKLVLWCYLIWYLSIVTRYFDPSPTLWLSSIGIAAFIGFALNLAARQGYTSPDRWVVFRLYLFPFCVSSYSALIKGKGFFLLFPRDLPSLLTGACACATFVLIAKWLRHHLRSAHHGLTGSSHASGK
jgi:hypothetical protein